MENRESGFESGASYQKPKKRELSRRGFLKRAAGTAGIMFGAHKLAEKGRETNLPPETNSPEIDLSNQMIEGGKAYYKEIKKTITGEKDKEE